MDERLEQLTKALLAQAAAGAETDRRLEGLTLSHQLLAGEMRDLRTLINDLGTLVNDIAVGTARLLRVAESHEKRIGDLEAERE
jgi:hypothetical protein